MSRNPSGLLVLSKALVGYLYYKTAEGLSDRSLESYERILIHRFIKTKHTIIILRTPPRAVFLRRLFEIGRNLPIINI